LEIGEFVGTVPIGITRITLKLDPITNTLGCLIFINTMIYKKIRRHNNDFPLPPDDVLVELTGPVVARKMVVTFLPDFLLDVILYPVVLPWGLFYASTHRQSQCLTNQIEALDVAVNLTSLDEFDLILPNLPIPSNHQPLVDEFTQAVLCGQGSHHMVS